MQELNINEIESINGGSNASKGILLVGGATMLVVGAPVAGALAGAAYFGSAYVAGLGLMASAL